MHSLGVGNVADNGIVVSIEHNDVAAVRHVDVATLAVKGHVIPSFFASDGNRLYYVVLSRLRLGSEARRKSEKDTGEDENGDDWQAESAHSVILLRFSN